MVGDYFNIFLSNNSNPSHGTQELCSFSIDLRKRFCLPSFSSLTYISLMDDGTWIPWCSTDYGSTNFSYENSFGFSDYYRQFKDRYTLLKNCMLQKNDIFGGKSFGVDKKDFVWCC